VTGILALKLSCEPNAHRSVCHDPLSFLQSAAYVPPHMRSEEIGKGILIFSGFRKKF
jgi:hypothetical protein